MAKTTPSAVTKTSYFGLVSLLTAILSALFLAAFFAVSQLNISPRTFSIWNNITLLVDPQVNYDLLIKVMDRVRIRHQLDPQGRAVQAALFPDIAMGDAPPASSGQ